MNTVITYSWDPVNVSSINKKQPEAKIITHTHNGTHTSVVEFDLLSSGEINCVGFGATTDHSALMMLNVSIF